MLFNNSKWNNYILKCKVNISTEPSEVMLCNKDSTKDNLKDNTTEVKIKLEDKDLDPSKNKTLNNPTHNHNNLNNKCKTMLFHNNPNK